MLFPDLYSICANAVTALAMVLTLCAIDDMIPVLAHLMARWRRRQAGQTGGPDSLLPEKLTAIFVPCWQEHAVIGQMVRHNLAAIRYSSYIFFLGVYRNDPQTRQATEELARTFKNVHVAVCPHDGPSSKADCLNWIYQHMLLFEESSGRRFETIVIHDAEDLIHPEGLTLINQQRNCFDMVQLPVLALPTSFLNFAHGIYCDEFAEYQFIDMPARETMGSFIPSNGVGAGYSRSVLEALAVRRNNRVFESTSLTEDYEIGVTIHELGFRQTFCLLQSEHSIATREYFPQSFRTAVRQRTRWVIGNALQAWQRCGWQGSLVTKYWFWRDRKGLVANPLSLLANLLFALGALSWLGSLAAAASWTPPFPGPVTAFLGATALLLQTVRLSLRIFFTAKIYGWRFALGTPLRLFYANVVNSTASLCAISIYLHAQIRRTPLVWLKTEHAFPSREALLVHQRSLEEILLGSSYLTRDLLALARAMQPAGVSLEDHLLNTELIAEEDLWEALTLKEGLPAGRIHPTSVKRNVARCLPRRVVVGRQVVPFHIEDGTLHLAAMRAPSEEIHRELQRFTKLETKFQIVTQKNYEELVRELL